MIRGSGISYILVFWGLNVRRNMFFKVWLIFIVVMVVKDFGIDKDFGNKGYRVNDFLFFDLLNY